MILDSIQYIRLRKVKSKWTKKIPLENSCLKLLLYPKFNDTFVKGIRAAIRRAHKCEKCHFALLAMFCFLEPCFTKFDKTAFSLQDF